MRILLLANNLVGLQVAEWLATQKEDEVVGVVLHPPAKRRHADEILAALDLPADAALDGSRLREPEMLARVEELGAEIAVSILFDYILLPELIDLFPAGVVNLHPSLLPYNRGQYPNVWSIVERTPAGVTLHYIDPGIDTGDVIAQREVEVLPVDTGATLYRRLERAGLALFTESWPAIRAGTAPRLPQPGGGTSHRTADVAAIDEIRLDETYVARDLLDLVRARTFPPYPGAFFVDDDGRRVYLRLQLLTEDELA